MKTIRRNDPCPCGSGKRYKNCCGALQDKPVPGEPPPAAPEASAAFQSALRLHKAGRLDEAGKLYREVLRDQPGHAEAEHLLGLVAFQSGRAGDAVELMRKAIAKGPSAQMHTNLGAALQSLGRLAEAEECYSTAAAIAPQFVDAHYNLGVLLDSQGRYDEAVRSLRKAIDLAPGRADFHAHLAHASGSLGHVEAALESYGTALQLDPRFAGAHNNRALLLQRQDRPEEAEAGFREAIKADPGFAHAHVNLGILLAARGEEREAAQSYRQALAAQPGNAYAYSNLLYLEGYAMSIAQGEFLALARGWEKACIPEEDRIAASRKTFDRDRALPRKLRIGYVSGDFCNHAVSHYIKNVLAHHDRTRVEVSCYYAGSSHDAVTDEIRALADRWVSLVGVGDAAAAERVTSDGIDVLVDLSGHTSGARLGIFARRAAPVQCHYLGFVATTGLTEMDYWIGDSVITPAEVDAFYSETVWRLPRTWVSYEGNAAAPAPDWKPDPHATTWLGSFNALHKLTPQTLEVWAHALRSLPESRLLLKTAELADGRNRQRMIDAFSSHGVAADRLELLDRSATRDWPSHMALYNRMDIALDPIGGVGGGTTTCDALWMSVPVVNLVGDRMGSRMTASMLRSIGHPEWITDTEEGYVRTVVELAKDKAKLALTRKSLRQQMARSTLCDSRGLSRALEDAYFTMYERSLARG